MLGKIFLAAFVGYMAYSMYSIYYLFKSPTCSPPQKCLAYYLKGGPSLQLQLFTSLSTHPTKVDMVGSIPEMDYDSPWDKTLKLDLPRQTRSNGSLYLFAVVLPSHRRVRSWGDALSGSEYSFSGVSLTEYRVPQASAFKLLSGDQDSTGGKPVTHIKSDIFLRTVTGLEYFPTTDIPPELYKLMRVYDNRVLPITVFDPLSEREKFFVEVKRDQPSTEVVLHYSPITAGKLRFVLNIESHFRLLEKLGFGQKDVDEVKSVFGDTDVVLLCLTMVVSAVHLVLDALSFKNDIGFWRGCQSTAGLSLRTVVWRAVSQVIVALYLVDEGSSLLVTVPAFLGALIELWKVTKVVPVDWRNLKLKKRCLTLEEKSTLEYDAEGMRYLSYVLYPLTAAAAVYSLFYLHHRSWYSWVLQSLVNCVYGLGFMMMLPQLFINYRLKSVAHMPWRAFMYKAFNTFIDDIFAFIIRMPTAHRLACFRDDVVFIVYLYQRWLYPVDKARKDQAVAHLYPPDEQHSDKKHK